jgi:exodeoxyribonuclease-5
MTDPTPHDLRLSDEQEGALASVLAALRRRQVVTLGGYAGTGKTSLVRELARRLPGFAAAAYTGKAAHVLRRKGVDATTIHSLIYRRRELPYRDAAGQWRVRVVWERHPAVDAAGFLIDEASMVGRDLYRDLLAFGLPALFVGDHGQLPPVRGGDFNLMARPDVVLETIHRNAGEVALFAAYLRTGGDPALWARRPAARHGRVRVVRGGAFAAADLGPYEAFDQIICATNKARVNWNRCLRDRLGLPASGPAAGDRVMCWRNVHDLGVFNGQQGVVRAVDGGWLTFATDGGDVEAPFDPETFHRCHELEDRGRGPDDPVPFDFCYAVTAHKAQGDEWDNVLVLEYRCRDWEHARWAYTAASRARERLTWVTAD